MGSVVSGGTLGVVCALALVLLGTAARADEPPQLTARIDRNELYEGESAHYTVVAINVSNPTEPDLSHFRDFDVQKLDEETAKSQVIRIRNGIREELIRHQRIYKYRLTPKDSGELTIPAPVMVLADGTRLEGNEVTIDVVAVEPQDAVFLEAEVDRQRVYLAQPIHVTLTVAVQALPGEASSENPMKLYIPDPFRRRQVPQPPELTIPWLDDELIPTQLVPKVGMSELFSKLYNEDGAGFQVNHIGRDRVGSLLRLSSLITPATVFQPTPRKSVRADSQGVERTYWEYVFTREFQAQDVGKFSFQPATLNGVFVGLNDSGRPVARRVYLASAPLSVEVVDAPREGRPANYTGAIGRFELSTRLSDKQAHVGDPLELEIAVRGTGTLDRIAPIDLESQPGVRGRFRVHEPTERTTDDARLFTYRIRPQDARITEVPSLEMAYFDTDREEYVTLRTSPIPLAVLPSDRLTRNDIIASPNTSETAKTASGGASADDASDAAHLALMDAKALHFDDVRWSRWITLWSTLIAGYAAACVLVVRRRRIKERPGLRRRRQAVPSARRGQRDARALAENGQLHEACRSLRATMFQLVADYVDRPASGMTTRDATEQLSLLGADEELIGRLAKWLDDGDAAQYGSAGTGSELLDRGQDILQSLLNDLEAVPVKSAQVPQ